MENKISVIVLPIYDIEPYSCENLDNVVNQTYQDEVRIEISCKEKKNNG